jgi:hypothetical protein
VSHQFLLKRPISLIVGEQTQDIRQSVVGHIQRGQVRQSAPSQGTQTTTGPLLDPVHPMVGLREHMDQPHLGQFAHAQSFALTMGRKVLVQQRRHLHALHMHQQERNIIRSFRFNAQGFFHSLSLPTFRFCVQI